MYPRSDAVPKQKALPRTRTAPLAPARSPTFLTSWLLDQWFNAGQWRRLWLSGRHQGPGQACVRLLLTIWGGLFGCPTGHKHVDVSVDSRRPWRSSTRPGCSADRRQPFPCRLCGHVPTNTHTRGRVTVSLKQDVESLAVTRMEAGEIRLPESLSPCEPASGEYKETTSSPLCLILRH